LDKGTNPSTQIPRKLSRRSQLHKRRQLFIRTRNKTVASIPMCIRNPDRDRDKPRTGAAASGLAVATSEAGFID
jgi:hypothetical protein